MARIAGVDLPRDKKVEIGLTYIFGIGRSTAQKILETTGITPAQRIRDLTDADVARLRAEIERADKGGGGLRPATGPHERRRPRARDASGAAPLRGGRAGAPRSSGRTRLRGPSARRRP